MLSTIYIMDILWITCYKDNNILKDSLGGILCKFGINVKKALKIA